MAVPQKYIRQAGHALDGTPILFVQGACYDEDVEPERYMLACCHALDSMLPPGDDRKATVLIDARAGSGAGWHNVPAHKMLPFFRLACSVLPDNFPERLQRVVIYPLPFLVRQLWRVVGALLDPMTREKFEVLTGSGQECPAGLRDIVLLDQLPLDARDRHKELHAATGSEELSMFSMGL